MPQTIWKKKLATATESDLIDILEDIIKTYPEVKIYLETTILGDADKINRIFEQSKTAIQKAILPGLDTGKVRFKERLHINSVKKILTDFKKLNPKTELMVELYIQYCDCLTKYLQLYADFGCWFDVPDFASKYSSLEKAIKTHYYSVIKSVFIDNISSKEEVKGELSYYVKDLLR